MQARLFKRLFIVALRNEKGSYSEAQEQEFETIIVALRNEKGSYSQVFARLSDAEIVALRNEKGSYSCFTFQKKN